MTEPTEENIKGAERLIKSIEISHELAVEVNKLVARDNRQKILRVIAQVCSQNIAQSLESHEARLGEIREAMEDAVPVKFWCYRCSGWFGAKGYTNQFFFAEIVANCPTCSNECWPYKDESSFDNGKDLALATFDSKRKETEV